MNAYEDLENRVRARGVRVEERLAILAKLQQFGGGEELAEMLDQHERSIEQAAKKVREVVR
ncbi:MAG: hypothetical protein GY937_16945 [bacterium]|nr:hypothetical protein [bacterium]